MRRLTKTDRLNEAPSKIELNKISFATTCQNVAGGRARTQSICIDKTKISSARHFNKNSLNYLYSL